MAIKMKSFLHSSASTDKTQNSTIQISKGASMTTSALHYPQKT